jgi:hypothetical protein
MINYISIKHYLKQHPDFIPVAKKINELGDLGYLSEPFRELLVEKVNHVLKQSYQAEGDELVPLKLNRKTKVKKKVSIVRKGPGRRKNSEPLFYTHITLSPKKPKPL